MYSIFSDPRAAQNAAASRRRRQDRDNFFPSFGSFDDHPFGGSPFGGSSFGGSPFGQDQYRRGYPANAYSQGYDNSNDYEDDDNDNPENDPLYAAQQHKHFRPPPRRHQHHQQHLYRQQQQPSYQPEEEEEEEEKMHYQEAQPQHRDAGSTRQQTHTRRPQQPQQPRTEQPPQASSPPSSNRRGRRHRKPSKQELQSPQSPMPKSNQPSKTPQHQKQQQQRSVPSQGTYRRQPSQEINPNDIDSMMQAAFGAVSTEDKDEESDNEPMVEEPVRSRNKSHTEKHRVNGTKMRQPPAEEEEEEEQSDEQEQEQQDEDEDEEDEEDEESGPDPKLLEQSQEELNKINESLDNLSHELDQIVSGVIKNKRQILMTEENLTKAMLRIDAVESGGDVGIRQRRKELIGKSESLLKRVDAFKAKTKTTVPQLPRPNA